MGMKKRILGASIGNCVHVAGVAHFLDLAEQEGYETIFLGPAVSIDVLYENVYKYKPDILSLGERFSINQLFKVASGNVIYNSGYEENPNLVKSNA